MKIDNKTTVVGFADALSQTLDIIARKMNEQQNQVNAAHNLIDVLGKQVNAAHSLIDNLQREIDELKNPTLFDK